MSCQAYVEKGGVPVARGGRRHRQCRREATTTRSREAIWSVASTVPTVREYALCGQHATQWDRAVEGRGFYPNLSSDW